MQELDVKDWEANTNYYNCTHNSEVIKWFWQVTMVIFSCMVIVVTYIQAIKEFNAEQKSRLLQFVTGTCRVPVSGFKDLVGELSSID